LKLVHFTGNGDTGLSEDMRDLRFTQSRGVIFKGQPVVRLVNLEAPQAVSVREFAQPVQLLKAQGRLQFVCNFEECHAREYSRPFPAALDAI